MLLISVIRSTCKWYFYGQNIISVVLRMIQLLVAVVKGLVKSKYLQRSGIYPVIRLLANLVLWWINRIVDIDEACSMLAEDLVLIFLCIGHNLVMVYAQRSKWFWEHYMCSIIRTLRKCISPDLEVMGLWILIFEVLSLFPRCVCEADEDLVVGRLYYWQRSYYFDFNHRKGKYNMYRRFTVAPCEIFKTL